MKMKKGRTCGKQFSGSSQRSAISVAGKQYPFLKGAIQMSLADAESLSLEDFPEGSIVEFEHTEDFIHVRAIQKITAQGAEVVLMYRAAGNHPVYASDRIFSEVAKGLITWRQRNKKDIIFCGECPDGPAVAAIVPVKGGTVREAVAAAKKVMSETMSEMDDIENQLMLKLKDMWDRDILPARTE